jgi:nitrite reductase/ring-hydroxylating ferredoxin subunit
MMSNWFAWAKTGSSRVRASLTVRRESAQHQSATNRAAGERVAFVLRTELPEGEVVSFKAGDVFVAVVRLDGVPYALADRCTHAGCHLSKGLVEGDTLLCPCHGGLFDVRTGAVLDGPPLAPVKTYAARDCADGIEVEV